MELLKLVIVDDEPILLEGLLKTYDWAGMGFEVVGSARDGDQAIQVIKDKKPNVVLTDIRMKKVSGLQVMQEIEKEKIYCLFVVLSAYRDFEYAKQACDLGAFAYLLKPINDDELRQTMCGAYESCIQKKYLINIVLLLALALLLSSVGVGVYVRKNISNVVLDKYEFMTEKMGITLDGLYKKSEEVTAECITDKNVQRSLQAAELELGEKNALSKYFAYTDLDYVSEYCYIDNKENVYTKSYSNLSYKDFKKSGIEKKLSSNYAKTQWFFQEDTLFQTGRSELFIGRNVRNMEDAHAPGMLFFKMDEKYLESIVEEQNGIEDIVVGVVDDKGNLCMQYTPESFALNEQDEEKITGLFKYKGAGMILERERLRSGMLQAYRQQESGFTIFTLVPNTVLNRGMTEIALVLLVIYLVVIIIANAFVGKLHSHLCKKCS